MWRTVYYVYVSFPQQPNSHLLSLTSLLRAVVSARVNTADRQGVAVGRETGLCNQHGGANPNQPNAARRLQIHP